MAAVLYTTTAAIRAAVGVTAKELPDSMFSDQGLETQVRVALYQRVPTYQALYTAGMESDAEAADLYAVELLELFCLYFGAVRSIEMILAMRKSVTDGKQKVDRFAIDWAALLAAMQKRLDDTVDALEEVVNPGSGGVAYFGKAVPDYDPVTNL